jgi:excisionase family DNA binding protein
MSYTALVHNRFCLYSRGHAQTSGAGRYTMEQEAKRDMLTVAEAAQELGISVRGVQDRLLRGAMHGERLTPRMWVIPRDEVDRWKDKGRLRPGRPKKRPE